MLRATLSASIDIAEHIVKCPLVFRAMPAVASSGGKPGTNAGQATAARSAELRSALGTSERQSA